MFVSRKEFKVLQNTVDALSQSMHAVAVLVGVDPKRVAQLMQPNPEVRNYLLELARELKRQLYITASKNGKRLPSALEAEMEASFAAAENFVRSQDALHGPTDAKHG